MLPSVKARIVETYSRNCVDISSQEAENIAIMSVELGAVDVAELFSPRRFTDPIACHKLGLKPGFAIDLCEQKTVSYTHLTLPTILLV